MVLCVYICSIPQYVVFYILFVIERGDCAGDHRECLWLASVQGRMSAQHVNLSCMGFVVWVYWTVVDKHSTVIHVHVRIIVTVP